VSARDIAAPIGAPQAPRVDDACNSKEVLTGGRKMR
jgi:hypothetical protein